MSVLDAVKKRRSIRKFHDKEIPEERIDKLREALLWAPSAGNLQARKFYFVNDSLVKDKLAAAAVGQNFIAEAPLVIVACCDKSIKMHYGKRGETLYTIQDVSASLMGMMLVAYEEGLGTAWVGAFHENLVSKILVLPENLRPVTIVPVGYPDESPKAPERISLEYAIIDV